MFRLPSDPLQCREALSRLNIPSDRRSNILADPRKYRVAPWHYKKEHRMKSSDGNWTIRKLDTYKDDDGLSFEFAPPNYNMKRFIEEEIESPCSVYPRGSYDDSLPHWVKVMKRKQEDVAVTGPSQMNCDNLSTPKRKAAANSKRQKSSTPRPPRKRPSPEEEEINDLKEIARDLQAKLDSALSQIDELNATVKLERGEKLRVTIERDKLLEENSRLKSKIEELEEKKLVLSYEDLKPGGVLEDFVKDFTYFPNFACNDAFLHLINFTEGCEPGKGFCENLVRYSKVSIAKRKEYYDSLDARDGGNEENEEADF